MKVGDKVKIKNKFYDKGLHPQLGFGSEMRKRQGEEGTIEKIKHVDKTPWNSPKGEEIVYHVNFPSHAGYWYGFKSDLELLNNTYKKISKNYNI